MASRVEPGGGTQPQPTPRPGTSPTAATPRPTASPSKAAAPRTSRSATGGSRPANDHALVSGGPFWGNPDDPNYVQQNIVTIHTDGLSFQVNSAVAAQMAGLIHDLVLAGYKPKAVGGYNNRPITGGTEKSNHAYGAAIDIDALENPRYGSGAGGKHRIPDDLARQLAAKWGLFWGGDYKKSKDYMHFEALGAPRTPGSPAGGAPPVVTPAAKAAGATVGRPVAGPTSTATAAAGGTTTGGGDTGLPPNATPQQVRDRVAQQYGYLASFLDMPEVGAILMQAAREDWSEQTLMGALSKTNWWKTTSATSRQWDALNKTDHATARAQVDAKIAEIQATAAKTGLVLSPIRVHDLAVNSLKFGWTGQQMTDALVHEGKLDTSGKTPTDALSIKGHLKERAAQYLVPLADSALEKWTLDVVSGRVTQEAFDSYLKEQAKSMFPGMSAAIDSGVTVAQYVDPYKQIAADTLDVPVESINFSDPKWNRALFQTDPKTGARASMSLADWQRTLRTDPAYGYVKTGKAIDQGASFATLLTQTWGATAA